MTTSVFTPRCSRCSNTITADEERLNEGLCAGCLRSDQSRRLRPSAARQAEPPGRPWWPGAWWLGVEATACALALIVGALMLDSVRTAPSLPGWWLAISIALVVLGPANVAMSAALWLMRRDDERAAGSSLRRCLVVAKVVISVVLFPLLIVGIVLMGALYAKLAKENAEEWTGGMLGVLFSAVLDRPRQRTGSCALCGRVIGHEGEDLCGGCVALGKRRPAPRLLYGGRLAGSPAANGVARKGHFSIRRKAGWKNYVGVWHVIVDDKDVGTLERGQEGSFEVADTGPHRVKVRITLQSTNAIDFTGNEDDVILECGRDEDDMNRYRLVRVDTSSRRHHALDSAL